MSEVLSEVLDSKEYDKLRPIIEHLEIHNDITPKEAELVSNKSAATVRRYLKRLVDLGMLEMIGNANKVHYKLLALTLDEC